MIAAESFRTHSLAAPPYGDAVRRILAAAGHLERNDAYNFFDGLDDLIRTGPSGTNVNDLVFLFCF